MQVLVGLFGVSLRTLGMSPGCHGAVPLQQPTLNLIGYCTGMSASAHPPREQACPVTDDIAVLPGVLLTDLLLQIHQAWYQTHEC